MRKLAISLLLIVGTGMGAVPTTLAAHQQEGVKRSVEQLLATVHDEDLRSADPEQVKKAILELGALKRPELIGEFINLLDYRVPFPWEQPGNPLYGQHPTRVVLEIQAYPAVSALIGYGEVAIPILVDIVRSSQPESLKSKNAVETIAWVVGDEYRSGALKLLRAQAEKERVSLQADNLRQAADLLQGEIEEIERRVKESDRQANETKEKTKPPQ